MRRVTCYVAGPYSAPQIITSLDHMRVGMQVCYDLLKKGFSPFCPWHDFLFSFMGPVTIQEYYEYSISQLRRQESMLVLPNWETSKGTNAEIQEAERLGIPIFFTVKDLVEWRDREVAIESGLLTAAGED